MALTDRSGELLVEEFELPLLKVDLPDLDRSRRTSRSAVCDIADYDGVANLAFNQGSGDYGCDEAESRDNRCELNHF